MASINFFAGENFAIQNLGGSGLGMFSSNGFGFAVSVGEYQGSTFITSADGATEGPQVDNNKWVSTSGVSINNTSGVLLTELPDYLSTLQIRFTHGSAVKVQNTKLYGYDRVNKNNFPSGVTLQVAAVIHANTVQDNSGSGDASWHVLSSGSNVMDLVDGPGLSGLSPNGPNTQDTEHWWHAAVSMSPTSVGSKTSCGLFVETEFL